MSTLKISIYNSHLNQKYDMEVPDMVTGDSIIKNIIKHHKIPVKTEKNEVIEYKLIAGKKGPVQGVDITAVSLKKAGIQNGEQLILFAKIYAA